MLGCYSRRLLRTNCKKRICSSSVDYWMVARRLRAKRTSLLSRTTAATFLWQSSVACDNQFGRAEWTVSRRLSLFHRLLLVASREEPSNPTKYLHLYPDKGKIASRSTKWMNFLAFSQQALSLKKCPIKQAEHWAVACDCNCRRCCSSRAQIAMGPFSRPTACCNLSKWTAVGLLDFVEIEIVSTMFFITCWQKYWHCKKYHNTFIN